MNSFCAAKVDASSTDQAAAGDRRRAKEAIQEEKQAGYIVQHVKTQHEKRSMQFQHDASDAPPRCVEHDDANAFTVDVGHGFTLHDVARDDERVERDVL